MAGVSADIGLFIFLYIPCPGLGSANSHFFSRGMMTGFSFSVFGGEMENLHVGTGAQLLP